jgi:hypothetical protein
MPENRTTRARNAALLAELEAWARSEIASDATTPSPFVNLRTRGFARIDDAQAWARAHGIATVKRGNKLLARRADIARINEEEPSDASGSPFARLLAQALGDGPGKGKA